MRTLLASVLLTLAAGAAAAQDFELELTEQSLNRLVGRLGNPSDGGIHQPNVLSGLGLSACVSIGTLDCAGAANTVSTATAAAAATGKTAGRQQVKLSSCVGPDGQRVIVPASESVAWQWWITEARFLVTAQQLRFAATVVSRVAGKWHSEQREVPATLRFDVASQRLRMEVSAFKVPVLTAGGASETLAEVDVARHMSFAIPIGEQSFEVRDLEGRPRTLRSRAQGGSVEYQPGRIQVKVDGSFY
jgi:hypothetical protein